MLRPLHHSNSTGIKTEITSVSTGLLYSLFFQAHVSRPASTVQAAKGACRPDPRTRCVYRSLSISILAEAATIEHQSTPHYFFWQTAAEPCKLHPDCDISLVRYCKGLTDHSKATLTPPTSQPEIQASTDGALRYLSVREIRDLWRLREESKAQQWALCSA
jgi:hypothetical protein